MDIHGLQTLNPFIIQNHRAGRGTTDAKSHEKRSIQRAKPSFFSLMAAPHEIEPDIQGLEKTGRATSAEAEVLPELLDAVHSAGDALKKRPHPDEIQCYREAVKKFIRHVVHESFAVEESTGLRRINKPQKKYTTIAIIDQKLENLAASIMAGQIEQLQILTRIDEITGMVIDLLN
ncbi:MAG: YaaR family protein [Spirochaetaceae bacterium]|nr:YaaR family protein [Spirochaetaceae bacterium]